MSQPLKSVEDATESNAMSAAIAFLHEAQALISDGQAICEPGSQAWHRFETVDDRIHEALEVMGD